MKEALDLVRVPWDALRLLGRHWPVLVTVCALGLTARQGLLWLAVAATRIHPTFGALLLPLAPMAMMVSLVVMLQMLRPSLSLADAAKETPAHHAIIVVLLPFLAVYASQGYLVEDRKAFFADTAYNEIMVGSAYVPNFDRLSIATGWIAAALILIALVVRKLLIGYELPKKHPAWGALAVYVEVLWMMLVAAMFAAYLRDITTWVETRQAWAWWIAIRDTVTGYTGIVGAFLTATVGALGGFIGAAGALVVVPVSWLSIGALIYGTKLAEAAPKEPTEPTAEPTQVTRRELALRRARERARKAADEVIAPVTTPVKSAWAAFRKIAVAGVAPMALFCLVFVLAQQLSLVVAWFVRTIVGPREYYLSVALSPLYTSIGRLVYLVAMAVLLAAAINRVVESLQREVQQESSQR